MNSALWVRREWGKYGTTHVLVIGTLVMGMTGLFLVGKLKASFLLSLRSQEKEALSSDLALSSRRQLLPAEIQFMRELARGHVAGSYDLMDMTSMLLAPQQGHSALVDVRVVDPLYPFHGKLLDMAGRPVTWNQPAPCLWVSQEAFRLLQLSSQDVVKLGEASFPLCGQVAEDPGQNFRGFMLAPRVYLPRQWLAPTRLAGNGSIATHSFHLKLNDVSPEQLTEWKGAIEKRFPDTGLSVKTPRTLSEQTARAGDILGDYLQLASLVALLLAVVGCFYLARSLFHRRLKDVAVLRALGLPPARLRFWLVAPYVFDFMVALILGLGLAMLVSPLFLSTLASLFGVTLPSTPFPREWMIALPVIGIFVALGLMPAVEEAMSVPVRALLQGQEESALFSWSRALMWWLAALLLFAALAIAVTHSIRTGGIFTAGVVVLVVAILGFFTTIRVLVTPFLNLVPDLSRPFGLSVGLVIRRILRRPVPTFLILLSLGLGASLVSLLSHLQLSLTQELSVGEGERPSLFLFDVQDEQLAPLDDFLKTHQASVLARSPMVRARLTHVNGEAFRREAEETSFRTREQEMEERMRQRTMNLSFAPGLNRSETLEAGVSFEKAHLPAGIAPVSLEKKFAQRLNLRLGDHLRFDVLGVTVEAQVVNLRRVKWTSFLPNFFVVFAPGFLEEAPKSWLAAIRPKTGDKELLRNALVQAFPNISHVDVEQLLHRLNALFERVGQALQLMAFLALAVGILVVVAIAQDQLERRQGEIMLEKTLGLTPWSVFVMALGEFLVLGFLALLVGSTLGAILAGLLTYTIFDASAEWSWKFLILQTLGGLIIMSLPLLIGARRIFRWRPAGLLQSP